jgi:ketosteroid isomerase-like protein
MSQENVAVVEAAYEAFVRGGLDRFIVHWTDDLDHRSIEGAPDDRGPIHGKNAMRAYGQDWIDLFGNFRIEPVELIDAGEKQGRRGSAVRRTCQAQRGRDGSDLGAVFEIRDGKIARGREYATRKQALDAAGLAE